MNRFAASQLLIGLSISLALLGLSGCSTSPERLVDRSAVYTAGYYYTGPEYRPCYWTGAKKTNLPCGGGTHLAQAKRPLETEERIDS
jgi:hypothetical protein